jgi:hypothetical protein
MTSIRRSSLFAPQHQIHQQPQEYLARYQMEEHAQTQAVRPLLVRVSHESDQKQDLLNAATAPL